MKKKVSVLAALVLAVVVTAYSVSGTYAKYTSQAVGTDSARVAKWAFTIGDATKSTTNVFTFDLFKTVGDTNTPATDDEDVMNGTNENIIAPGTSGQFKIDLANNSEVNAKYSVAYVVTNTNNIPVEFSINGTDWFKDLSSLNVTDEAINMNNGEDSITVQWRWLFDGATNANYTQNDTSDTALGEAATAPTISVQATVTAVQVD